MMPDVGGSTESIIPFDSIVAYCCCYCGRCYHLSQGDTPHHHYSHMTVVIVVRISLPLYR